MVSSPVLLGALPLNILIINVAGSFVLGVFSILSVQWNLDPKYTLLVAVGFCGTFTTMSSFALESTNLLENKQLPLFAVNVLANVGLSLGAVISERGLTTVILETIR